jgi:glycerol kinase
MPRYIAAIDQGTTSTRCILFDRSGPVVMAQREHRQIFPQPGWVEHDPMEIWQKTQEVISETLRSANVQKGDIAAVGITNQRETTLLWDRNTGRPLCNAIVWQDTRTKALCDDLAKTGGIDRFRARTGLPLATYFSGPKMRWMMENIPEAQKAAQGGDAIFGTIETFLAWHLTGGPHGGIHITDATNASRTMLMDLQTLAWDDDLLGIFGLTPAMLPAIVPSSAHSLGLTAPDGPFGDAIPLSGILGDQQAALVGQTCFGPGESKNTYGTGCFMLLNTGEKIVPSKAGLITTVGYWFDGQKPVYALEGSIAVTGSLVQWVRDNLGMIGESGEIEELARSVPDNGGVYFVPAFSGLFAPYWRSDARGAIVGLSRHSNKGHLARAVLEATAYQTRDVLEAMHKDSGVNLACLKVDGGMVVNDLLMQFQADILGIPVQRAKVAETTAMGAAYAAGLAVGFWEGQEDLRANWHPDRSWNPHMKEEERQSLYAQWQKAISKSLAWIDG